MNEMQVSDPLLNRNVKVYTSEDDILEGKFLTYERLFQHTYTIVLGNGSKQKIIVNGNYVQKMVTT